MRLYNIILLLFCSLQAFAQNLPYPERAKEYVRKYAAYAIADQKATGVPASITLGQGILETEAGISRLLVEANNHFGIKCKNGWNGPTILHTDDAKNECFKKYESALESYNDHSAHLMRNQRYGVLFTYSPTDYARWAHGLKKCGYATNPQYAYQLIKIIEEYHLQEYTYAALDSSYKIRGIMPQEYDITTAVAATNTADTEVRSFVKEEVATSAPTAAVNAPVGTTSVETSAATNNNDSAITAPTDTLLTPTGDVLMVNGLKAIYVHKDESILPYAVKHKIRYAHLLEMNDLPDEPLAFDTYVYLEKKNPAGLKSKHKVRDGETLLMVAQEEGMQLKRLAAMNLLKPTEQPVAGTALYLQETASVKPAVKDVIAVYTTADEQQQNENPTQQSSNTMVAKPNEKEVGFGMGFEAPKEVLAQEEKEQEKKVPATTTEISRQPFMKDDPPQPQLRKPATEKEYNKSDKMYIVKRGDTAFSIAKRNGITVAQLLKWNNMEASDLKAGQTIRISE